MSELWGPFSDFQQADPTQLLPRWGSPFTQICGRGVLRFVRFVRVKYRRIFNQMASLMSVRKKADSGVKLRSHVRPNRRFLHFNWWWSFKRLCCQNRWSTTFGVRFCQVDLKAEPRGDFGRHQDLLTDRRVALLRGRIGAAALSRFQHLKSPKMHHETTKIPWKC